MSVRFHEAVSFDTTQKRLDWRDDFWGDSVDARWTVTGASVDVVDAQDGGIIRLTTGALTGNTANIKWNNIRSLHVDKKVSIETRVKLLQVTQCIVYPASLSFDGNNSVYFRVSCGVGAANYFIRCANGGVTTSVDSGILADTNYHIFRIECFPTGEVHFFIDGVETANSPITTNIPDDAGDYLQPLLYIYTAEDAAKSMDADYVYVRQER